MPTARFASGARSKGRSAELPRSEIQPVSVRIDETPGALHIRSETIEVVIQKHGLLVAVLRANGRSLMKDLSEPVVSGHGMAWDRESPAGERFYGLGPRPDPQFDLSGQAVSAAIPFLISTAGYGEFHAGTGPWRFDFTAAGRYRIEAPRIDYFFYFGPPPKEIFREHNRAGQRFTALAVCRRASASWSGAARRAAFDGAGRHVGGDLSFDSTSPYSPARPGPVAARAATRVAGAAR